MTQYILYGTLGCHLCEVAETQLAALLAEPQFQERAVAIECVDIADIDDSDELLQRYGERIPVLRRVQDGAELNWPFDEDALRTLLQSCAI